jgi:hypothetical protein
MSATDKCAWDHDGTGVYTLGCDGGDYYGSQNGDFDAPPDFMIYCFNCGKEIDWSAVNDQDEEQATRPDVVAKHAHQGSVGIDRGETCLHCGKDMHDPVHDVGP